MPLPLQDKLILAAIYNYVLFWILHKNIQSQQLNIAKINYILKYVFSPYKEQGVPK